jgi:hypothetical protein
MFGACSDEETSFCWGTDTITIQDALITELQSGLSNVAPRKHGSNSQARSWEWFVLAGEIV